MNEHDDENLDDELMARAAKLRQAVTPERDLWPGISKAISAPARRDRPAWRSLMARAAAVVLLVGGSSGITYMAVKSESDPGATTVVAQETQPLIFTPVSGSFGSRYTLGPDYQDARRQLAARVDEELDNLAPETREEVIANLESIRQAIEDINRALAEEPDSMLLQEMLLDTYRDELSLMKKVDGITRTAMRRGDI